MLYDVGALGEGRVPAECRCLGADAPGRGCPERGCADARTPGARMPGVRMRGKVLSAKSSRGEYEE